MSYAILILSFNAKLEDIGGMKNIFIMKLKTVALVALIVIVLMLLLKVYTLIENIGYVFHFGYCLGVIADILFKGSLGLFFYILYKKL